MYDVDFNNNNNTNNSPHSHAVYAMRTNKSMIVYGYAFESVKEGTLMRPGAGVGGGRGNVVDSRR